MDAERMANAETADELKDAAGTGGGPSGMDPTEPGGAPAEGTESFFGRTDVYPSGSGMLPPTGGLDEPSPTEAISEAETDAEGGRSPRQ